MGDVLNKILTLILVFLMLVVGPMLISYKTEEMTAKRQILNDVANFIDMVKDSGKVTQDNLDQLYIQCNSHGMSVDVQVKRLIRTEITVGGDPRTSFYAVDSIADLEAMNAGDVIQVKVSEVGISTSRRLMYNLLKFDEGKFEFTLAGSIG